MLIPLPIPPGVYRNGTNYQAQGRWYDADLVRWFGKTMRPFGGWKKVTASSLGGAGRGIVAWRPSNAVRYAGIGTPDKLWVWNDDVLTDITPSGFPSGSGGSIYGVGYGYGNYGSGVYGQTTGTGVPDATTWTLDNWGNRLVACATHNGVLYEWDGNLAHLAAAVANAPTMRSFLVTEERSLMAIASNNNDREVSWSDFENNTDWTPTATNAAGALNIQTPGSLLTGRRTAYGHLIWSTVDLHRMNYVGQPDIYVPEKIASDCGTRSPLSIQATPGGVFWMGGNSFFRYDGGQVVPLPSDVQDYVFADINTDQAALFASGHNPAFGEVYWWYCSAGSTTLNRCVAYNYRENHWNILPSLSRGCWAAQGVFRSPLAVDAAGTLFEHESGWTADGTPILAGRFATSGPIEIGSGDQIVEATQLVPDAGTEGAMELLFTTKFTPEGPSTTWGPFPANQYTDTRVTGRQVALTLRSLQDADFRFGTHRLDAIPGGLR